MSRNTCEYMTYMTGCLNQGLGERKLAFGNNDIQQSATHFAHGSRGMSAIHGVHDMSGYLNQGLGGRRTASDLVAAHSIVPLTSLTWASLTCRYWYVGLAQCRSASDARVSDSTNDIYVNPYHIGCAMLNVSDKLILTSSWCLL